ncbi:MAG: hypothetical protein GOVbin1807_217 [Prokaryotic dsDNA virus sp.]|nr:MAG: hypothetical protein GOVbin1807_217 [Prokaryotic dsDNA virus sp.]|tara:strand:+ start:253 stop:654 length:402 start_codon:yes stop_codon:yes gene_type:complete
MTNLTRAKNYSEFCENWRDGVSCYYTGWKALTCDGTSIMLNCGSGRDPIIIAEKVGEYLVVYNHRPKDYASDLMKYWTWTTRRCPNLVYATLGKPKDVTHDSWLSNQFYDGLLSVATHLLHPDQSIEELMDGS